MCVRVGVCVCVCVWLDRLLMTKITYLLYPSPRAAITNYHKTWELKTIEMYFLTILEVWAVSVPFGGSKGKSILCPSPNFRWRLATPGVPPCLS